MFNIFGGSKVPVNPVLQPIQQPVDEIKVNSEINIQTIPVDDFEDGWEVLDGKKITAEGYEYSSEFAGTLPGEWGLGFMSMIENEVNNKTVMRGAEKEWNPERLVKGKLASLSKIGSEPVLLTTPSKNKIDSCYFSGTEFFNKINAMGGQVAQLKVSLDHPFCEIAEPVEIQIKSKTDDKLASFNGAKITYQPDLEKDFYGIGDFLDLCAKMKWVPVWGDTYEPVQPPSGLSWYSRRKDIILMPSVGYNRILKMKDVEKKIEIGKGDALPDWLSPIEADQVSIDAIAFNNNSQDVHELLNDLKIDKTPFEKIEMDGKIFLVKKKDSKVTGLMDIADDKKLLKNPIFKFKIEPQKNPDLSDAGAVVLSMNQTNIYSQYTHEILTFLLEGVNVLVYDNAEKGLSTGSNNQQGLKEAVETAGEFLKSRKGFSEDKIMFKGQCAGGLPSSEAAATFPKSHIWIDQSPQNFTGVAGSMYADIVMEQAEVQGKTSSYFKHVFSLLNSTSGIIAPVVSIASKAILPSFDVNHNLACNEGQQIFTIGVPDSKGQGGDKLVPEYQSKAIADYVSSKINGNYLPMPGATHVTDWWLNPTVHKDALNVLERAGIRKKVFPAQEKLSDKKLVNKTYKDLTGSSFHSKINGSKSEDGVYQLLANTVYGNMDKVFSDAKYVKNVLPLNESKKIFKTCLDLSRQKGNKAMTLFFLDMLKTK